jgi:hypothetical protein
MLFSVAIRARGLTQKEKGIGNSAMSKMIEILEQTFTPDITGPLVSLFQRAYQSNAECFDPFIGHDEMVYGLMVHKSVKYFIIDLAEKKEEGRIKILQRFPRFLFQVEEFMVSPYRVGESLDIDPNEAFPRNRNGAWMLAASNKRQMSFAFMHDGSVVEDDSTCSHLILAHIGNVEEGLHRLFLGVPAAFDDRNRITGWSTIHEIWKRDGDASALIPPVTDTPPPQAPVEKVAPPTLSLKNIKKPKENQ